MRRRAIVAGARLRGRPVLTVVSMGREGPTWLQDRFAEVVRFAVQKLGYEVFFTGTAREERAVEGLRAEAGIETTMVGPQSVPEQTALFAISDLVLSVDTGPMHMARGVGVPMVVLAGCWDFAYRWLPVGQSQVRIVQGPYVAHPGENYQMEDLSSGEVSAALDEMARLYPPDQAARDARAGAGLSAIDHIGR